MKTILILAMAAGILSFGSIALAVPQQINYQGYLTATNGSPLDTTVAMTFRIYDAPVGGNMVWIESRPSVLVQGGVFEIGLGETMQLDGVMPLSQLWLGISVGNDGEMTPRERIVSVAYAYRTSTVDGASGGNISGQINVGSGNSNSGNYANVFGQSNFARGDYSMVSGGGGATLSDSNSASGARSFVGGGRRNSAAGDHACVIGGYRNQANGARAVVGGGYYNGATGVEAFVGGGEYNYARGDYSIVAGGGGWGAADSNSAIGVHSTIGGGGGNLALGGVATVAGGNGNQAGGWATIGGGGYNHANGDGSVIIGGLYNNADGEDATVAGGRRNQANGAHSFAAGDSATTTGDHSFALGTNINCTADSAFVWSDGSGGVTGIGMSRSFNVKATRGTRIWTSSDISSGVTIGAGGNAWVAVCDSTKKRGIRLLDTQDILNRFSSLPLKRWEYNSEDTGVEHIGPMAQDFWNAFHLGNEPLGISTVDADGVMMAAIQELAKQNLKLEAELNALRVQVQTLLAKDGQTQLKMEQ